MRFGFSRAIAFLSSLLSSAKPVKRSEVTGRFLLNRLAVPTEPVKHRQKTGGPNWLKIAINSQKHR